ncbi:MAG: hypothetical protein RJA20_1994 [Bacteroidota bacterium]
MLMVRMLTLWLLLCICTGVTGQGNRTISSITTSDGLSQGFVSSVFQDSRGFIWIGTLYGLNRYDGCEIRSYTPEVETTWALKSDAIYAICEGRNGILWLATDKGLVAFDPYSERFAHLDGKIGNVPRGSIMQLFIRQNGAIVTRVEGRNNLFEISPPDNLIRMIRAGKIEYGSFSSRSLLFSSEIIQPIQSFRLSNDSTIIAFDANMSLCIANLKTMQCKPAAPGDFNFRQIGNYGLIHCTDGNGYVFHLSTVNSQYLNLQFMQAFSKAGDKLCLIRWGDPDIIEMNILPGHNEIPGAGNLAFIRQFKALITLDNACSGPVISDKSGDLWAGTNGYGVRIAKNKKEGISHFAPKISFSNFVCLHDDKIWPGHFNQHIVYNTETDRMERAPWKATLPESVFVNSLFVDKSGNWWALTTVSDEWKLQKYTAETGKWSVIPVNAGNINGNRTVLTGDKQGNIWFVAGDARIIRVNPVNNHIEEWDVSTLFPAEEIPRFQSYCSAEDRQNTLWIGVSCGLIRIDNLSGTPDFRVYHNFTPQGILFASNHLLSVYPDRAEDNIVWIGTKGGGLCKFDKNTAETEIFTTHNGLNDNVIYGILPDSTGKLWLSTNRGISCYDLAARRFFNPFAEYSPLNIEFNTGGYRQLTSGKLAFGSVNGLFIIDPAKALDSTISVKIAITGIRIRGTGFNTPENASFVTVNEDNEFQIVIPFSQNNISVSFVALPENSEKSVRYRYRIPTISNDWIETGSERTINLAGMTYGSYQIEFQAAPQNADWSQSTRVYLQIEAPWYASNIAWLAYAALIFATVRLYTRRNKKRLELKHAVELGKLELDRMKTTDEFKARFYSYITHEFKTPLTILLNLASRIGTGNSARQLSSVKSGIIQQAENMLELVNQVMDVSRFNDKNPELHWRQGDIGTYVNLWVESFRPLAEFKQISLEYSTDAAGLIMDFDPIRLKYIINNLLSNALRHTPQSGSIKVALDRCNDARICLKVSDNGEGISSEDLPLIFNRNFRGKSKSRGDGHFGLGLAFVRDLVLLFNGEVKAESQPGIITKFTIYLPITNKAPLLEAEHKQPDDITPDPENQWPETGKLPLLLIADDNQVILSYLQSFLSRYFQVLVAPDGKIALEMALEHLPDIVLTDLVMPEIDGLQLTDFLKANELTCHIPVVMLSARSEVEDRIQGHQHGIDSFVPKPFHEQELVLILQNMLLLQQRWRERFQHKAQPDKAVEEVLFTYEQDYFSNDPLMKRMYDAFAKYYTDEELDLDQLCHILHISRSQLQRKTTAIASGSPMELLREFRLQRAHQLFLSDPHIQVKEVCTMVGFKNPAHFSTLFTKRFGVSPSELRKQMEV